MTILCEPDRGTATGLAAHLGRQAGGTAGVRLVDNLTDAAAWVGYSADERLVVVGAGIPFIDVVAFADYMHAIYPDALVVLLRGAPEDGLGDEARAAGIFEVVAATDAAALVDACARARAVIADRLVADVPAEPEQDGPVEQPLGRVITVFSAKGGTGKTLVSTNLAVVLNAAGARRVCLVDLDLEFGDVAITLQLTPRRTIGDVVAFDVTDPDVVDELVTSYGERFDCLLAPVNPGDAEKVTPSVVAELLLHLRERYDYVVVDTPSQLSEHVLEAFDAADHQVLVTTPEIPSLKNLRLALDMLDLLNYDRDSRAVLLNRADPKTGLGVADAQAAIRHTIAAKLPASQDVPASINRGVPLAAATPQHALVAALRTFAVAAFALSERSVTTAPAAAVPTERRRRLVPSIPSMRNRSA